MHPAQAIGSVKDRLDNKVVEGLFDCMADRRRRAILRYLEDSDCNVTDLTRSVGIRQQAVSYHLTILKLRGLVRYCRQGKSNYYKLTDLGRKAVRTLESAESAGG